MQQGQNKDARTEFEKAVNSILNGMLRKPANDVEAKAILRGAGILNVNNNVKEEFKNATEKKSDNICCSVVNFIGCVMYWIYYQSPYHLPRKIDEIVNGIKGLVSTLDSYDEKLDVFYLGENVESTVRAILMDIKAFRELNLSQLEYLDGVDIDSDKPRIKWHWDGYTVAPPSYDFVDITACIRNISQSLKSNKIN